MAESLLGRGWNPALRLYWCAQGRIRAVKVRFIHSPLTPLIRTRVFVIVDLFIFNLFDGKNSMFSLPPWFLWRLQQNDPEYDVSEHIQVFFGIEIGPVFLETVMNRFQWWLGEIKQWLIENRTYGDRDEEV
ncbi:hypothetical protein ACFX2H_013006 [Malus domestica]